MLKKNLNIFLLSVKNTFNGINIILLFLCAIQIMISSCSKEEEPEIPIDPVVKKLGCTDITACNYDPTAEEDDGGCFFDCLNATLYGVDVTNKIVRIDPNSGDIIKSLTINTDPNFEEGLAIAGERLYYINGSTLNKVIVIDTALTEIIDTLQVDFPPRIDALAVNGDLLYALDFLNNELLTVNLITGIIDNTLELSFTGIGGICYAGNRGTVFISSFNLGSFSNNMIYEINPETGEVINSFDVAYSPFGLAYSNTDDLLFVSTGTILGNPTLVVSPDDGQEMCSFPGSYSALAGDESL